jgi:hypothetical protein
MSRWKCNAAVAFVVLTLAAPGRAVDIYIIEDSGFFGIPGVTQGAIGKFSSSDPAHVTVVGNAGDGMNYGGIDFRSQRTGDFFGFENTTNSLRQLGLTGGSTLIDSVGHIATGVAAFSYSNDGLIAYAAGTDGVWGRIVEADALTGEVIEVHNFLSTVFSGLATVPEGTALPFPPGELWGLVNTSSGVNLVRVNLDTNTTSLVGGVTGLGFQAQFETGLDWAPDGTLYAAIQGFRFIGGGNTEEVSSHLFTINPFSAQATDLGVIQADLTWDGSGIAVALPPCPLTLVLADLPDLVECLTGPAAAGLLTAQCICRDIDLDDDIDLRDFAALQEAAAAR